MFSNIKNKEDAIQVIKSYVDTITHYELEYIFGAYHTPFEESAYHFRKCYDLVLNHDEIVNYLRDFLKEENVINYKKKSNDNNILHEVLYNGIFRRLPYTENAAQILVESGINIHDKNNKGDTVLHALFTNVDLITRHPDVAINIVQILIDKGFDINVTNNAGIHPIELIFKIFDRYQNNLLGIIKFLVEKGAKVVNPSAEYLKL